MKKVLFLFTIAVSLIACKKDIRVAPEEMTGNLEQLIPPGYQLQECIVPTETALMAGQSTNVGTVTIWNDDTKVYVSYQTTGSYKVKRTHLYVGACNTIPVNGAGNPRIGLYPYSTDHGTGVQTFTYEILRSSLPAGCLCVSSHAEVVGYNSTGGINFTETGWGYGEQVTDGGSWAMKFGYCQQLCDEPPR